MMYRAGVLFVSLMMVSASVAGAESKMPELGDRAPGWELSTPAGETVTFEPETDGPAVILFWATWCPYCAKLMPPLQDVAERFQPRDVPFHAINVWEDSDPVAHMEEHGFTFQLLLDGEDVAARHGVHGTPGLFVVGPDGRVLYRREDGATGSGAAEKVEQTLDRILSPASI